MTPGPISEQTDPRDLDAQDAIEATQGADMWKRTDVRRQSRRSPGHVSKHVHEFPSEV